MVNDGSLILAIDGCFMMSDGWLMKNGGGYWMLIDDVLMMRCLMVS